MQIDVSRFRAAFYVEAAEHLEQMEAALLQLEQSPRDVELLNTIFRAAHSIKGASTTFGIDEVGRFTHVLENLLDRLRDGLFDATSETIEVLLASVDVIDGLIANAKDGADLPENLEQVLAELNRINGAPAHTPSLAAPISQDTPLKPTSTSYVVTLVPSRPFFQFGQDPAFLVRELAELTTLSSVKVDATALPTLAEMDPETCYLTWRMELATEKPIESLQDVFMFLDDASRYTIERSSEPRTLDRNTAAEVPVQIPASESTGGREEEVLVAARGIDVERRGGVDRRNDPRAAKSEAETVRVDRHRLDELINQIGELVIGSSMVEQDVLSLTGTNLASMSSLAKIVRDLQEMSLALRMVPIGATFQKMNRVIRDVAKKCGKQVQFITSGDDTELDKSVVDKIGDPLVHMVRNAVDHGIETPEARLAAGKPVEGVVKLRAYQQSGNVYIELSDDGQGLHRKKLLAKAIERGLVAPDAILSDTEICNLIFAPGFSTAAEVTDVSGRGVGMDVVRRNVEALQGSVSVRSVEGQGSTITVRLPLTLAILDGLLVRLTQEVFVIPLLSVVESICVKPSDIQRIVGVGEVIMLRGKVLPLIRMNQLLGIEGRADDDTQGLLVIVDESGRQMAWMVDELIGQQQVVIKNLETNLHKVQGIAGATILGDGRVALILDAFGISNLAGGRALSSERLENGIAS